MLTNEVRQRIRQLRRTRLPNTAVASDHDATGLFPPPKRSFGELPDGYVQNNQAGQHFVIQRPLDQLWPAVDRYLQQEHGATPRIEHDELDAFRRSFPDRAVFFDLETCGLAGSMVFLCGLLHCRGDQLVLSQLWARNYAEEHALIITAADILSRNDVVVSYNGKSFDWPQVRDRYALHERGAELRPPETHLDLVHHARRRWRPELPNCKLQTLESHLCGRRRSGDIAGRDIPQAYHDYVRTGDTTHVRSILHHNALDLVTLLQLSMKF